MNIEQVKEYWCSISHLHSVQKCIEEINYLDIIFFDKTILNKNRQAIYLPFYCEEYKIRVWGL